jgi:hypothetical protein
MNSLKFTLGAFLAMQILKIPWSTMTPSPQFSGSLLSYSIRDKPINFKPVELFLFLVVEIFFLTVAAGLR